MGLDVLSCIDQLVHLELLFFLLLRHDGGDLIALSFLLEEESVLVLQLVQVVDCIIVLVLGLLHLSGHVLEFIVVLLHIRLVHGSTFLVILSELIFLLSVLIVNYLVPLLEVSKFLRELVHCVFVVSLEPLFIA